MEGMQIWTLVLLESALWPTRVKCDRTFRATCELQSRNSCDARDSEGLDLASAMVTRYQGARADT